MKPTLFIGSSTESLNVSYAIQENLEHVAEVTVWTQGIFDLSKYSVDALLDALDGSDFGAFVFAPDDISTVRGSEKSSIRDNVVFELGLSVGRLGRERSFIVLPKGSEDALHFPTDLLELTPALYDSQRQDGNLQAALGPACSKISKAMIKLGKLSPPMSTNSVAETPTIYSEEDKMAILQSWMGPRSVSDNLAVIHFQDVDRELRLESGTAKKYLKEVARTYNYVPAREGDQTILFAEAPQNIDDGITWMGR